MPITLTDGVLVETTVKDKDQFDRTGVIRDDQFAICDELSRTKQIKFDATAQAVETTATIATSASQSADATITLPSATGTLATTADLNPAVNAAGNSGASKTLTFTGYTPQALTLTASCTLTIAGTANGGTYLIKLTQGGAGSYTVTWPEAVKWPGGVAPTLTTDVGAIDVITLFSDGTNLYGNVALDYS